MVFAAYREHKRKMAAWEREREEEKLRREASEQSSGLKTAPPCSIRNAPASTVCCWNTA